MNGLPVEAAYTLLCTCVDQLPMTNPARREELLVSICAITEGFMHLIRSAAPQETRDGFLANATEITETARRLASAWPDQLAYAKLHSELSRFILILSFLRGKSLFHRGD